MVIKEWRCPTHGDFEGSHPICPGLGCASQQVERVILTAPGGRSSRTKQTDAGVKDLVDGMRLGNLRSARDGEASYGGQVGSQLLWGSDIQKNLGMSLDHVVAAAAKPFTVQKVNGQPETVPHGMRLAAQAGITQQVLPAAKLTVSKDETRLSKQVKP